MKLKFKLQVFGCRALFSCHQCLSLRLTTASPMKWHCGISGAEISDIHKSRQYKNIK